MFLCENYFFLTQLFVQFGARGKKIFYGNVLVKICWARNFHEAKNSFLMVSFIIAEVVICCFSFAFYSHWHVVPVDAVVRYTQENCLAA